MRLATLFALPLLAAAVPTSPLLVQADNHGQAVLAAPALAGSGSSSGSSSAPVPEVKIDLDLDELRLVQFGVDEPPVWITERQKIQEKQAGRRFMDITDTPTLGLTSFLTSASASKHSYPKPGKQADQIKPLFKSLDVAHMKSFLKEFSGFRTRYYRSETGRESQRYLLSTLREVAQGTDIKIREFEHTWGQNSIIARFPHTGPKNAPIIVVGAHQDSTNMWPFLPAPGADDDGSGTTSALEAFRALAAANVTSHNPIEFHWFSAEEGGLLGSQAVAKAYEEQGVKVRAMLQMDMTAWVKQGTREVVGVVDDYVDPDLTQFVHATVEKYLDIPPVYTKCGYACSDHASFSKAGYQSAFSIESTFEDSNKNIHSTSDTIDHPEFSFTHMREFSKLAIAFALELGAKEK